jgi:acetyl-CoA carboxylase biotin carboxyl carrier protein
LTSPRPAQIMLCLEDTRRSGRGGPVELSDLKDILRLLEKQEITEFELEQDGVKLRVCRSTPAPPALAVAPSARVPLSEAAPPVGPDAAAPVGEGAPPAEKPQGDEPAPEEGATVASPIVGTFYRAPDPNSPPFVNIGDRVQVGQVLCIVEAMKLMNEIEAEVAGEVVKIHPENGQPVQYGDALFTIRPA